MNLFPLCEPLIFDFECVIFDACVSLTNLSSYYLLSAKHQANYNLLLY